MQRPLQITSHDFPLPEVLEAEIRERAAKLDGYYDGVIGCRVVIEAPVGHHRKGGPFAVRIDLTVPGAELVVNRKTAPDLQTAVRDAFDAARRRLEDYGRRQRGAVKVHESTPQARVRQIFLEDGYGFLETPDGRELYFHRNSVVNANFEDLEPGLEVRFAEEQGEKGPQASTVSVIHVHKNHA